MSRDSLRPSGRGAVVVLALAAACKREPPSAAGPGAPSKAVDAAVADDLPWPDAGLAFESGFAGNIGERLTLRAQLAKNGSALTGYYRYPKSQEDLTLAGTVDPHGHFTLAETNDKGVVTGHWDGVFRSTRVAAGTWSSADGARHLPFTLVGASHLASLEDGPVRIALRHEASDAGFGCSNTVSLPVVSGLVPPDRNARVNAALAAISKSNAPDQVSCDSTPDIPWWSDESLVIEASVPGYLALMVGVGSYSGGAHPLSGGHCALLDTETATAASLVGVLGSEVASAVTRETATQLRAFLKDNDQGPETAETVGKLIDDAHVCYVDARRVEVRFSAYEVCPYSCGAPTFSILVDTRVDQMPASAARKALFGR